MPLYLDFWWCAVWCAVMCGWCAVMCGFQALPQKCTQMKVFSSWIVPNCHMCEILRDWNIFYLFFALFFTAETTDNIAENYQTIGSWRMFDLVCVQCRWSGITQRMHCRWSNYGIRFKAYMYRADIAHRAAEEAGRSNKDWECQWSEGSSGGEEYFWSVPGIGNREENNNFHLPKTVTEKQKRLTNTNRSAKMHWDSSRLFVHMYVYTVFITWKNWNNHNIVYVLQQVSQNAKKLKDWTWKLPKTASYCFVLETLSI